jgi:hypothetical protein
MSEHDNIPTRLSVMLMLLDEIRILNKNFASIAKPPGPKKRGPKVTELHRMDARLKLLDVLAQHFPEGFKTMQACELISSNEDIASDLAQLSINGLENRALAQKMGAILSTMSGNVNGKYDVKILRTDNKTRVWLVSYIVGEGQ